VAQGSIAIDRAKTLLLGLIECHGRVKGRSTTVVTTLPRHLPDRLRRVRRGV